ncbi:AAA family ATPase [Acidianus sulfidivorans JP7]|uniref:Dephospho-CoA kinase n=2 Tax=Acidianus TaxID=12914 RepID=A0A2U9INT0_9CREN|nr:AAA family ATPase [Acidianus sulfidivorans JP7]
MPGSGKSLLSEMLKERGFTIISMSGVLKKRYEKEAKLGEKLMDFAKRMREIYGDGVVARLCIEEVTSKIDKVAFDGVRSLSEVEEFKRLGNPIIIAVHSPPYLRYERIISRMRPDDSKNINDLKMRDMEELKFGLGGVIAMADYMIVNDSTIDEFKRKANEILSRILK